MAIGEAWGREAQPGWRIGLTGELGAGKTQLVKGLARGLGISGRILSPTFTLIHRYAGGRLPLFHLDFYRLEHANQIVAAGLEEYLRDPPGVTVVEWAERWLDGNGARTGPTIPEGRWRRVWIETVSENQRRIAYEDSGA